MGDGDRGWFCDWFELEFDERLYGMELTVDDDWDPYCDEWAPFVGSELAEPLAAVLR